MRVLKQLLYGIFWILVFSGLIYGFYAVFVKPSPSCFDNRQNGNEEGVDCGPVCGTKCLPTDIKALAPRGAIRILPISTSSDRVSVLIQLQNANSDYAAKKFGYTMKLIGKNGFVMTSVGESFMYAGEIKYLAFSNLSVNEAPENLTADFQIQDTEWAKDETLKKPTVFLQNSATVISTDRIQVDGKFVNGEPGNLKKALVVAVLYDSRGSIIGVSQTETENIVPSETRTFTIIHPFISSVNTSATQVFVYATRP